MTKCRITTFLLLLVCQLGFVQATISCLSNDGAAVDWWVVLKVPGKINKTGYGYYDSRHVANSIVVYSNPADQRLTALWRTLDQINTRNL